MSSDDELSTTSSFSYTDDDVEGKNAPPPPPPPPRKRAGRRHSVDFKGNNEVFEFEKAPEEQRDSLWYAREEYDIIKERNSLIVKMMRRGSFQESKDHTFRGLEHNLKAEFKEMRRAKYDAWNLVLEGQDRPAHDMEEIADVYADVAMNSKYNAFALAVRDAEEAGVQKIWDSECGEIISSIKTTVPAPTPSATDGESSNDNDQQPNGTQGGIIANLDEDRLRRLFGTMSQRKSSRINRRGSM